jgi:hypothetical protein
VERQVRGVLPDHLDAMALCEPARPELTALITDTEKLPLLAQSILCHGRPATDRLASVISAG